MNISINDAAVNFGITQVVVLLVKNLPVVKPSDSFDGVTCIIPPGLSGVN